MNKTDLLIVISDLFFLSKITTALEAQHCSVHCAAKIPAILEKARLHKPALLILDLEISSLEPAELVQQIRSHPDLEALPIMAYTNHTKIPNWQEKLPGKLLKVVPNSYISANIGDIVGLISTVNANNHGKVGN